MPADALELTRLRVQMFGDMGRDVDSMDGAWRARVTAHFEERLADSDQFAAFVVDGESGALAACAVGWLDHHLPSPAGGSGDIGYVANVATDPGYRRRGYARATMVALVDWMRTRDVRRVDLSATAPAEGLYRSLGFTPHTQVPLSLIIS